MERKTIQQNEIDDGDNLMCFAQCKWRRPHSLSHFRKPWAVHFWHLIVILLLLLRVRFFGWCVHFIFTFADFASTFALIVWALACYHRWFLVSLRHKKSHINRWVRPHQNQHIMAFMVCVVSLHLLIRDDNSAGSDNCWKKKREPYHVHAARRSIRRMQCAYIRALHATNTLSRNCFIYGLRCVQRWCCSLFIY